MPRNAAFATLLTRVAYLPGTLVLEWTLRMVGSQYPLVVMVNPSLPKDARDVLATRKIKVVEVDDLRPEEGAHSLGGHDIRFKDTWTKLRCALFLLTRTSTTMERCFTGRLIYAITRFVSLGIQSTPPKTVAISASGSA
jgi:hypothetical protein